MKNSLLFTFFILLAAGALKAQCPIDITFTHQDQIDSFSINYPTCTELPGDLIIDGSSNFISSLQGLSQIIAIEGDLKIQDNGGLTSLSGLEGLQTIGGGLTIDDNYNLSDISALSTLTSIGIGEFGRTLWINYNNNITDLTAFGNTTLSYGDIHLIDNDALVDLTGLEMLDSAGIFNIVGNDNLENLSGLENLSFATHFNIHENSSLTNLSALNSLSTVAGPGSLAGLSIKDNNSLTSLSGLESLTNIVGALTILDNALIVDLSGLTSLVSVSENTSIGNNASLTSLTGLEALESVEDLRILDNESLVSIQSLSNINSSTGYLYIKENNSLTSLSGLEGVTEFEDITIQDNQSLSNLSGLSNTTSTGYLVIQNNDVLTNLSGLDNLTSNTEYIKISDNEALVDISALNPSGNILGLNITGNNVLPIIDGFSGVDTIFAWCYIHSNPLLTEVAGLNNVKSIGSDVTTNTDFLINGNDILTSVSGFNNLETVHGKFQMDNNPLLSSLNGFTALDSILDGFQVMSCTSMLDLLEFTSLVYIDGVVKLLDNTMLATCDFPALCSYVIDGGTPEIGNNAGCSSISDLLLECFDENTIFIGSVILDTNLNCLADSSESTIGNMLLTASNNDYSFTISTDSVGNYWIPLLEGEWNFNFTTPSNFWSYCYEDSLLVSTGLGDTILLDGILTPEADCPYIDWDVSMSALRVCTPSTFVINYCNYGAQAAIDHVFSVALDNSLTFENSNFPYTIDSDNVIHFEIDSIGIFDCGYVSFSAMVDCDSVEVSDILCLEVNLNPNDLCSSNADWDESTITANGYCTNDSIFFELENIGTGNMATARQFTVDIVIDDIVMMQDVDDFQLESGQIEVLSYELNGMGMRLEADQSPDHPVGGTISIVVPSCDNDSNNVVLTLLPEANNGNPFFEKICGEVIGSYDPNLKSAIPTGVGSSHIIDKDWTLEYTIQFQNTGNDTAFLVVIKDTLSENLDLTTLKVNGSSHDYTWSLNQGRELVFTFENILLVDSFTNEPGSHGYVGFEITPKATLIPGEIIENRVGIYFDFNDPIITNTVFHTIRKPVVGSSEHTDWCEGEEYDDFEITQDTAFQYVTEFIEYDSVHFVHLDVNPTSDSMVIAEVLVGEYLNDVLISSDTMFTSNFVNHYGCDSLVTYTVAALTNIHGQENTGNIQVYPNPFKNQLHVLNHENGVVQHWTVANNMGQVIWRKTLVADTPLDPIDLNQLPVGVYWLKVNSEVSTRVWRIVKH